ncbi:MAG: hypothetical protein LBB43_03145 [Spirochaetaceae bacterium]|jgi:hypothetical protein|nr:hypothetical protein [Spirochaetaceae bacterium]
MKLLILLAVFALFFCTACPPTSPVLDVVTYNPQTVISLSFPEEKSVFTIKNMTHQTIFLIKVNKSNLLVKSSQTGGIYPAEIQRSTDALLNQNIDELDPTLLNGNVKRLDHEKARRFNENPPYLKAPRFQARTTISVEPLKIGAVKTFWVEGKSDGAWEEIKAVVSAQSEHCVIWRADEEVSEEVSQKQCEELAARFDDIYRYVTGIFGYEYGRDDSGGIDGDMKIHILVYDIDWDKNLEQASKVAGFFWSKDSFSQEDLDKSGQTVKTNQAEILYLDSFLMAKHPDLVYSTTVHELQHMINFNEKTVEKGLSPSRWYNEMLSLMAEDIIDPLLGITLKNTEHPVNIWMPYFLNVYYSTGLTEWHEPISYATAFAFGAYLTRNFGGAALLYEIAHNDAVDIESLSMAIGALNKGQTFDQAMSRYGEALIFSGNTPAHVLSFDRTVTSRIKDIDYTLNGFDIWKMDNAYNSKGPLVFDISKTNPDLYNHSVLIQSYDSWQNATGQLTTTVVKPSNTSIELYLMLK